MPDSSYEQALALAEAIQEKRVTAPQAATMFLELHNRASATGPSPPSSRGNPSTQETATPPGDDPGTLIVPLDATGHPQIVGSTAPPEAPSQSPGGAQADRAGDETGAMDDLGTLVVPLDETGRPRTEAPSDDGGGGKVAAHQTSRPETVGMAGDVTGVMDPESGRVLGGVDAATSPVIASSRPPAARAPFPTAATGASRATPSRAPATVRAAGVEGELSPTAPTRYTWKKEFARGGLGAVWLAHDRGIARDVAVKELLPAGLRSPDQVRRFLIEARITGQLEHPGIVPIYEAGLKPDGCPFYSMRLLEGRTYKDAIDDYHQRPPDDPERPLEFNKLLSVFVDVCHAMGFAHDRGVLHRDLKPLNVMVGSFGEAIVVDWGLAKALGKTDTAPEEVEPVSDTLSAFPSAVRRVADQAEGTHTLAGTVMGTPAYMSPEQASGRLHELDARADIFSLGVILYEALTNTRPFQGNRVSEILENARTCRYRPPREVDSRVSPALNAICLKAMASDPRDRYQTSQELGEEVSRWLAGEPVQAYPEPWWVRSQRWIRKHKTLVTSVVGSLLVLTIISVVAAVVVDKARRAEAKAKVAESKAKDRAEHNFDMARQAVNNYYTRVSENVLLNTVGMQDLRKDLLADAIEFYEKFIAERKNDPEAKDDLALAYFNLGRLTEDVKSPADALPHYQQARKIQEQLLAKEPGNVEQMRNLSLTINATGRAEQRSLNWDKALQAYQQAAKIRKQLVAKQPKDAEANRLLANSYMNIGLIEKQRGKLDDALQQMKQAQDIRDEQLKQKENEKIRRDLGMGQFNLAFLYIARNDLDASEEQAKKCIQTFKSLAEKDDKALEYKFQLALAHTVYGDLESTYTMQDGITQYEEARRGFEPLVEKNPLVGTYRSQYATMCIELGRMYFEHSQEKQVPESLARAGQQLQIARENLESLLENYPKVRSYRETLATAFRESARIELAKKQPVTARGYIKKSIEFCQELLKESPQNSYYQTQLKSAQDVAAQIPEETPQDN